MAYSTVDVGKGTGQVDLEDLERQLRKGASSRGVTYDDSDLQGILRNISYDTGGTSLEQSLKNAFSNYDERAINTPGVDLSGEGHTGLEWWPGGSMNPNPTPGPAPNANPAPLPPGTWNATATPGLVFNPATGEYRNVSGGQAAAPRQQFPAGDSFGSLGDQGPVTGADTARLQQLFDQVNTDLLGAGQPVVDVPGINMNEDIDASLLSLMRGTDDSTQETDSAIRTLLDEVLSTARPDIPERSLGDFYDQDRVNRRMLTATENAQLGQQGLLEQLRAQLGDAGVVGLPGAPQGLETAGARRVTERVAVPFSQELRQIQGEESERALDAALQHLDIQTTVDIAKQQGHDARELGALQLATGWSGEKAGRVLQAAAAATDRQRILSEIALETLQTNQAWNAFLATFGLERERFLQEVRSGNLDRIGGIINSFQQYLSQIRGGFIGAQ